jgi:hypothetical protein
MFCTAKVLAVRERDRAMLEISFPGLNARASGRLAQQLRAKLASQGLPENAVRLAKDRTDTMDVGTCVQIAHTAITMTAHAATMTPHVVKLVAHAEPYLATTILAKDLFHLLYRMRSGVKLVGPGGAAVVGAAGITAENLKTALDNVLANSSV